MWAVPKNRGFTIVELLIVIVVIGILAAITIVAFSGVQERARYAVMQSDIRNINNAIIAFQADNGYYPRTGTAGGNVTANPPFALNIPGLVPQYLSKMPVIPDDGKGGYYAYLWGVNGVSYKIVRLIPSTTTLPSIEASNPGPDTARANRGWGYWSPGPGESL